MSTLVMLPDHHALGKTFRPLKSASRTRDSHDPYNPFTLPSWQQSRVASDFDAGAIAS
ncbi:MAG TPA: hypothetical protein VFW87_16855 [Pirellulales bacterium]|nr:hypothetical protein [Pirellulales bacterium]